MGGVARGDAELREALGEFLSGPRRAPSVRAEILGSWRRVASEGLKPGRFDPTYDPDLEQGSRLELAAMPVLNQLGDDLAGTETSLVLTDERAHVVDRRVSDRRLLSILDDIHLCSGLLLRRGPSGDEQDRVRARRRRTGIGPRR